MPLSLWAMILVTTLYNTLVRSISLNSEGRVGCLTLGIKTILVLFITAVREAFEKQFLMV